MPGFNVPDPVTDVTCTKEVTHDKINNNSSTRSKVPNSSKGVVTPDDIPQLVKLKESLKNSGFMKHVDTKSVLELQNIFNQVIEDRALNENSAECKSAKHLNRATIQFRA